FGGQPFLDLVLPKVRRARELISAHGGSIWLQLDGGVSEKNIARCAEAGADVFVAGSAVFSAQDAAAAVTALRSAAQAAVAGAADTGPADTRTAVSGRPPRRQAAQAEAPGLTGPG
ncbi:MAG: hypothetical protein ACLP7J_25050, partial [Streptosporangiaceae bacterium]